MPKILIFSLNAHDVKNIIEPLKNIGYVLSFTDNKENFYKE